MEWPPQTCPDCGSDRIVKGRVAVSDGAGAAFAPEGLPLLKLERDVRLLSGARFYGCRDCDLVWSRGVAGHLALLLGSGG